MAYTGDEIGKILYQKIDKAYTGYYDSIKANRLLKDVLTKVVEVRALQYGQSGKIDDEISPLVVYGRQLNVNNNKIPTQAFIISVITWAGPTVTLIIENQDGHNLVIGDQFNIENPIGVTGLLPGPMSVASNTVISYDNGVAPTGTYTQYSGRLNSMNYLSDYWHLLNMQCNFPSASHNEYITGRNHISGQGKVFGQAKTYLPRVTEASNHLFIEPLNVACTTAKVWYIKRPQRFIDITDTVYDFGTIFNDKMISKITDVAAKVWAGWNKDTDAYKIEESLIIDNP